MILRNGQPVELQQCVVSVWHSGTRTLVQYLGLDTHQHFLHYDAELRVHYGGRGDLVHVPIRHPMAVAESWARRGKPIEKLIGQYFSMFAYLEREEPVLHKVEDLPRLAGLNDRDVERERTPSSVARYEDRLAGEVVAAHEPFFKQFYEDPYESGDGEDG